MARGQAAQAEKEAEETQEGAEGASENGTEEKVDKRRGPMSQEAKDRIKNALLDYYKEHEGPMKGRAMSDESKEKIRQSHLRRQGILALQAHLNLTEDIGPNGYSISAAEQYDNGERAPEPEKATATTAAAGEGEGE